jgi:putative endonuclease
MERGGCVYIMTNIFNTVYYIGVTSDLYSRVVEHKHKRYPTSFTAKYNCTKLVYFMFYDGIEEAIAQEKRLKKWNRDWKVIMISDHNPNWIDLFSEDL